MADRRRGLPTKIKGVTRVNSKTGKVSVYRQKYHVNPFEKTASDKPKNSVADQFSVSMSKRPAKENRMKVAKYIEQLTPNGGEVGTHAISKIINKTKSNNDISQVRETYFDQILSEGFFKPENFSEHKGLLRDTSKLINNLPQTEHMYNEVIGSIIKNNSNITGTAITAMLSSFQDHSLVEKTLKSTAVAKSESYEREDMLHDYYANFSNPVNIMGSLYKHSISEPVKSSIQSLYSLPNDQVYTNNTPKLSEHEQSVWNSWIDLNNKSVVDEIPNGKLFKTIMIELSPKVASRMFKADKQINIPMYQSTLLNFSGVESGMPSDFKEIKPTDIENDTNFNISGAKFIMSPDKKVYLMIKLNVQGLHERDFVSVPSGKSSDLLESFNKKLLNKITNDGILSEAETKKKLDDVTNKYSGVNDNNFLIVNT